MKKISTVLVILLLTACTTPQPQPQLVMPPQSSSSSLQSVATSPSSVASANGETMYEGSWFRIMTPNGFTANPKEPVVEFNENTFIETDEATFTSPDGLVEFYVFSPLWGGEPAYIKALEAEELVDTKTEVQPGDIGDTQITWRTFAAKDGGYTRSYVSTRSQIDTGSDTHQIFGIQYANQAAYDQYKDAYTLFKDSLQQYSD